MAAYEKDILEIAAKKLYATGKSLQSPELRYEKADFLKWLQDNIKLEEVIQALFKHACLANGVRLTVYNHFFEESNSEVLDYILEENILRSIIVVFATGQSPQDSSAYRVLQQDFNFKPESANEIISIVGSVLNTKYEPRSIAIKEYNHFLKKTENYFLETRTAICYNIAQKEIDRLQSEFTGSLIDDLKCALKIILSTMGLIHYDLLPSPWNETISFTIEGGTPQQNILPSVLYSYYSTLKDLLELANNNQDPIQYKAIFISRIEPFLTILQKEGNSFFAKNISHHYKWHCLELSVLLDLPKLIHRAEEKRSKKHKEETNPPSESVLPLPPLAEIDTESQPTCLQPSEENAAQSK
jgi:hypothetical protein